jgi:hypothetical protein
VRRPRSSARKVTTVTGGADIPPGEAHDRMVSMIGKLGRVLSRPELEVVAVRLNEGRLPADELARIVEHVLEKEGDAGRYFEKGEVIVPRLGNEIAEAFDIRVGVGRHLYWYRNGVFRDTGREQIERAARRALSDRYKRRHAEELGAWFRAEQQQIPDEPEPAFLNVANGMLDWRTGELRPHAPEFLSIIQSPVAWNPDAACPATDTFLSEVLPSDAQRFAKEVVGYTLLPAAPLRKAILLLGSGSNGKTTLLSQLRRLLGRRNVSSVPLQAFGESRFASAEVYGKLATSAVIWTPARSGGPTCSRRSREGPTL